MRGRHGHGMYGDSRHRSNSQTIGNRHKDFGARFSPDHVQVHGGHDGQYSAGSGNHDPSSRVETDAAELKHFIILMRISPDSPRVATPYGASSLQQELHQQQTHHQPSVTSSVQYRTSVYRTEYNTSFPIADSVSSSSGRTVATDAFTSTTLPTRHFSALSIENSATNTDHELSGTISSHPGITSSMKLVHSTGTNAAVQNEGFVQLPASATSTLALTASIVPLLAMLVFLSHCVRKRFSQWYRRQEERIREFEQRQSVAQPLLSRLIEEPAVIVGSIIHDTPQLPPVWQPLSPETGLHNSVELRRSDFSNPALRPESAFPSAASPTSERPSNLLCNWRMTQSENLRLTTSCDMAEERASFPSDLITVTVMHSPHPPPYYSDRPPPPYEQSWLEQAAPHQ